VLADRRTTLVDYGVLVRQPYQERGTRRREEYHLTPAGRELGVVLGALQQWGDDHLPRPEGPTMLRKHRESGRPLRVSFVDEHGQEVRRNDVTIEATGAYLGETAT
jgi:HxlR-like helix-turn-helix